MLRCRHKLASPELAGCTTWETLKEAAGKYPNLRPCPREKGPQGTWMWIHRDYCETCGDAIKGEAPA